MRVIKLTTADGRTRVGYNNETQWGANVTHETDGVGELCGPGWLHAYEDILLAVLHNPVHAKLNPDNMIAWEAETGDVIKKEDQMKLGTTKLTTIRQIPIPEITTEHRVRYVIFCALEVYQEPVFVEWANNWLSGVDRSVSTAEATAAMWAAKTAAMLAWEVAATAAMWAAMWAATAAAEAEAAEAAATAAKAEAATEAAVRAATMAVKYLSEFKKLNLLTLVKKAVYDESS